MNGSGLDYWLYTQTIGTRILDDATLLSYINCRLSSRVGQLVEITLREGRRLSCIYLVHSDATAVNTAAGAGGCTAALCR